MRIWVINHHAVPPSEPGGTRHFSLGREWVRQGDDVVILASSFNHATGRQIAQFRGRLRNLTVEEGVSFLTLRVPGYGGRLTRMWNMIVFAFWVWSGLATRNVRRPDVIVGSSLTLLAAFAAERLARRLDTPFVLEVRDLWPQTLLDMGMKARHPAVLGFGLVERYVYRHADRIVTLLPHSTSYIASRGGVADAITWVPNGVDIRAVPAVFRPRGSPVFTVLYLGSHGLSDGLEPIIEAAAILKKQSPGKYVFRFIGEGPAKHSLRALAEAIGLANIQFEDPVPRAEVFQRLSEADAFIFAAKRTNLYQFGLSPNKLHEYMAAGRPTIFAVKSANDPIFEADAGITIPPEDAMAIAEAVSRLAAMTPQQRFEMGMRGRRYVEQRHDFPILAKSFRAALSSAIEATVKARDNAFARGAAVNVRVG